MLQSSGSLNVKDTSTDEFLGVFILMVRRGMERSSLAGFWVWLQYRNIFFSGIHQKGTYIACILI